MIVVRVKKKSFIFIASILAIVVALVGFRVYLHANSIQRENLKESALANGPWARQSIWNTSDGLAYLLSQKTESEKIKAVTAYFYINENWHKFKVNMTYGNTLLFTGQSDIEQFTGEFDIENGVFIVKVNKVTSENDNIPPNVTYEFSESENYDAEISNLPFEP